MIIDAMLLLNKALQSYAIHERPTVVVRDRHTFERMLDALVAEGAAPKGLIDPRADKIQVAGVVIQHVPRKPG